MQANSKSRLSGLTDLGHSLWLDSLERGALENGDLKALIDRGEIRGMTSNPSIFDKAITSSHAYDEGMRARAWAGWASEQIYWDLVVEDVLAALAQFRPLYEESGGADGYVSLEVNPHLAHDTAATLEQAQKLWREIDRPNLLVKIPATEAGLPAIRQAIAAGVNVNITLIFSRFRYAQVAEAYIAGLEERVAAGRPISKVASVASFFVSRIDTKVDARLPEDSDLRGKAAIANARLAYMDFRRIFSGARWEALKAKGAKLQRPLWASTSTKNPLYRDTLYVDELIGRDTVNTLPTATLDAARDHGQLKARLGLEPEADDHIVSELARQGIDLEGVASELEADGVRAFSDSIDHTLHTLEASVSAMRGHVGELATPLAQKIRFVEAESVVERLWDRDPELWTTSDPSIAEVRQRLGWLDAPQRAPSRIREYKDFAHEIRADGIDRILVLGMGGSSLAAEVFGTAFPKQAAAAGITLGILDSTHPTQVLQAAADFPPDKSLYVVSSKSGGTAEVLATFEYFWPLTGKDGSRFIAISDAGTSLQGTAQAHGFRRAFEADATVGGRFSALTDFGLVPAALLGLDLDELLERSRAMQRQCGRGAAAHRNPAAALGALLATAALGGRDKLTILADPGLETFANWIEQLVAESSGKAGKGILPIAQEPLGAPGVYGADRLFVYLSGSGDLEPGVQRLRAAGQPAVTLHIDGPYGLGGEIFRWEMAVAVACHILGLNAFDQPDVQESKQRTQEKLNQIQAGAAFDAGAWDLHVDDYTHGDSDAAALLSFVDEVAPNGFVGVNAYVPRGPETAKELQRLRVLIRERAGRATTVGFGPRFQHSTGQYQKGGPNLGSFIQIVSGYESDVPIPEAGLTFGQLLQAQALGDYETLIARGRRAIRVYLDRPQGLATVRRWLSDQAA